ncbi:MAG: hypothetical protein QOG20_1898 [Pseudonocardiales bacterium]|jgi:hypothetical protein|nr:hypothetical protein [Pseudonocardiales bacterium]
MQQWLAVEVWFRSARCTRPHPVCSPGATPSEESKTSINSPSDKDIAAALRANQVDDPEQWARRIGVDRPYPTTDRNLTKLRQDLAQYNPDPETLNKIIATLRP